MGPTKQCPLNLPVSPPNLLFVPSTSHLSPKSFCPQTSSSSLLKLFCPPRFFIHPPKPRSVPLTLTCVTLNLAFVTLNPIFLPLSHPLSPQPYPLSLKPHPCSPKPFFSS